ncbi:enolase-phosphatase E1-like isoform X2 [Ambystoma mexicanum]|uniref:enolase-phosphatase E1-like isoform X2 n=1 Tax=Ambystoma mexicanum TaxID=8296 RepID=UPI0037E83EC6
MMERRRRLQWRRGTLWESGSATELQRLWKELCEQESKAHTRNRELLQDFQRIETHIAILSARTEDLRKRKQRDLEGQRPALQKDAQRRTRGLQDDQFARLALGGFLSSPKWTDTEIDLKNSRIGRGSPKIHTRYQAREHQNKICTSDIPHTDAFHQTAEVNTDHSTDPGNHLDKGECHERCMCQCHHGRVHHNEVVNAYHTSATSGSNIYHRSLRNPSMVMKPHISDIVGTNPYQRPSKFGTPLDIPIRQREVLRERSRLALQWDTCPRCAWPGEIDTYNRHNRLPHSGHSNKSCPKDKYGKSKNWAEQQHTANATKQTMVNERVQGHCSESASEEDQLLDTRPVRLPIASWVKAASREDEPQSGFISPPDAESNANSRVNGMGAMHHTAQEGDRQRAVTPQPCTDALGMSSAESTSTGSVRVGRTKQTKKTKHDSTVAAMHPEGMVYSGRESYQDPRSVLKNNSGCNTGESNRTSTSEDKLPVAYAMAYSRAFPASANQEGTLTSQRHGRKSEASLQVDSLVAKAEGRKATQPGNSEAKQLHASHGRAVVSENYSPMSDSDKQTTPPAAVEDQDKSLANKRYKRTDNARKSGVDVLSSADKSVNITPSLVLDERSLQTRLGEDTEDTLSEDSPIGCPPEGIEGKEGISTEEWTSCFQRNQSKHFEKIQQVNLDKGGLTITSSGENAGTTNEGSFWDKGVCGATKLRESDGLSSSSSDNVTPSGDEVDYKHIRANRGLWTNTHSGESRNYGKKTVLNVSSLRTETSLGNKDGDTGNRQVDINNTLDEESEGDKYKLGEDERTKKKKMEKVEESELENESEEEGELEKRSWQKKMQAQREEAGELETEDVQEKLDAAVKGEIEEVDVDAEWGKRRSQNQEEYVKESEESEDDVKLSLHKEMKGNAEESSEEGTEISVSEKEEGRASGEERFNVRSVREWKGGEQMAPLAFQRGESSDEGMSEEDKEGFLIEVDKDFPDVDHEICQKPEQEGGLSEEEEKQEEAEEGESDDSEEEGAEEAEADEEECEGSEEVDIRGHTPTSLEQRSSSSEMGSMAPASHNAAEPEGVCQEQIEQDPEQELVKVMEDKEDTASRLLSTGGPPQESTSFLKRLFCLTSCAFPGLCRKRSLLRRSSQDSLLELPGIHPVETAQVPADVMEESRKDKMEDVGEAVGTESAHMDESEGSSSESESESESAGEREEGKSLENEDSDSFYD